MPLKIIGLVMIVISSALVGTSYIKILKSRICGLESIIEFLNFIRIKMEYELIEIPKLLSEYSKSDSIGKYIEICSLKMQAGLSLSDAWSESIDAFASEKFISNEDKETIKKFGEVLGETDINGQISNIEYYKSTLNLSLEKCNKSFKDKSKTALSCSIFSGLIMAILLV